MERSFPSLSLIFNVALTSLESTNKNNGIIERMMTAYQNWLINWLIGLYCKVVVEIIPWMHHMRKSRSVDAGYVACFRELSVILVHLCTKHPFNQLRMIYNFSSWRITPGALGIMSHAEWSRIPRIKGLERYLIIIIITYFTCQII